MCTTHTSTKDWYVWGALGQLVLVTPAFWFHEAKQIVSLTPPPPQTRTHTQIFSLLFICLVVYLDLLCWTVLTGPWLFLGASSCVWVEIMRNTGEGWEWGGWGEGWEGEKGGGRGGRMRWKLVCIQTWH